MFWPVYLVVFMALEVLDEGKTFHVVHCFVDDIIPFNEFFVIPYLTWHVLIPVTQETDEVLHTHLHGGSGDLHGISELP